MDADALIFINTTLPVDAMRILWWPLLDWRVHGLIVREAKTQRVKEFMELFSSSSVNNNLIFCTFVAYLMVTGVS